MGDAEFRTRKKIVRLTNEIRVLEEQRDILIDKLYTILEAGK